MQGGIEMSIKAIGFDIGGTLVNYNKPLNWSASYRDAIKFMCEKNEINFTEERFEEARQVLQKYNTRVNPREIEVSSDTIFGEIFERWGEDTNKLKQSKKSFYEFFQREVTLYDDTQNLLEYCRQNNIKCCVYTDVAYGMDDEYSLKDIEQIQEYIDLKLTSENVGYRKPNRKGFETMLQKFDCKPQEMVYVGDEQKDIIGPHSVGMSAILINRGENEKEFNQDYTIKKLTEIIKIIEKEAENDRKMQNMSEDVWDR